MKKLIVLAVVTTLVAIPQAQAGGFSYKSTSFLNSVTGLALGTRDVNVLNGTTVAVGNNSPILSGNGNNSSILSGIGNGNSVLNGIGILNRNGLGLGLGGKGGHKRW
jgi:hypothetical protein